MTETIKPFDKPAPELISELIAGERIFDSSGFSLIKITSAGVEHMKHLPIKSTGVSEFQEELRGKAPRPPVKKELIKKNSADGKAMGLPHDRLLQVFDNTDEAYLDALEKHNQDFIWQVIIFAIDVLWKKADGAMANTFEEKKGILKSTGITGHHTDQIFRDVQDLTRIKEEEEDFLPGN